MDGLGAEPEAPPPEVVIPAAGAGVEVVVEVHDPHPGWVRQQPDIDHKPVRHRNVNGKFDGGLSALGEATGMPTPFATFQLLFDTAVMDRIIRCTNPYLEAHHHKPMDRPELLRYMALLYTMGLKRQGDVPSYWSTQFFGR